jgi:hypothetical protein
MQLIWRQVNRGCCVLQPAGAFACVNFYRDFFPKKMRVLVSMLLPLTLPTWLMRDRKYEIVLSLFFEYPMTLQ